MVNYSLGKIYELVNTINRETIYIGSTCNTLSQRWRQHKLKVGDVKCRYRIYELIRCIGVDNVEILLIEQYPCSSKIELNMREGYFIKLLKPVGNCQVAGAMYDEFGVKNVNDYLMKYRENNKDKIKGYYEKNKDRIREYQRKYRENNKDKIKGYYEKRKGK